MSMTMLSFRGPGDDWDPQGYDDAGENAEELNKLGMHTDDEKDEKALKEKDDDIKDEEEKDEKDKAEEEEEEEEAEDVDDLKELERLEKKLKQDELAMGTADEE